jgi:hypothetical protein
MEDRPIRISPTKIHHKAPLDRGTSIVDVPNREDNEFLIYVRSQDCTIKSLNTDIEYKISPTIEVQDGYHLHLSLHSAEIPYSFYSITENNNIFSFTESENDYITNIQATIRLEIPFGNYSIRELLLEIQTLANVARSQFFNTVYTLSYSGITNKITMTTSVDIGVTVHFEDPNSIAINLGFERVESTFDWDSPLISTTSCQVFNIHNLYFSVSNIKFVSNLNVLASEAVYSSILAKIPVNSEPLGVIYFEPQNMISNKVSSNKIEMLHVSLRDSENNLINLNGLHWEHTLHLRITKNN